MALVTRRRFLKNVVHAGGSGFAGFSILTSSVLASGVVGSKGKQRKRPNILFAIADDWSWPHATLAGAKGISTPNFDRVAQEGVIFTNTFCAAPQCSPNHAAILTGRHIWQLEEAGTHGSLFPNKFAVYTDLLEGAGYHVGFTGKGWGPGNWRDGGWGRM